MKDDLTYKIIGCVLLVHHNLGPGLLESIYEKALMIELKKKGLNVRNQVPVDILYDGQNLGEGLRLDIIVEDEIILELKSVEKVGPICYRQLLTYLKVTNKKLGFVLNFNEVDIMEGVHRVVNNL